MARILSLGIVNFLKYVPTIARFCEARKGRRGAWDEMLQETTKLFFSLLSKPNCISPLPCYGIMLVTSKGDKGKKIVGGQLVKHRIVVLLCYTCDKPG